MGPAAPCITDTSAYENYTLEYVEEVLKEGQPFVDYSFPAVTASLLDKYHKNGGASIEQIDVFKQIKWKRMGEYNAGQGTMLWNQQVDPTNLKLGRNSNVHMLTAIYVLAL